MDKKLFDSLDESLKEKLRNCKSDAEMQKIIAESGMQELSLDVLEGVSGGDCCVTLGRMICVPYDEDKREPSHNERSSNKPVDNQKLVWHP